MAKTWWKDPKYFVLIIVALIGASALIASNMIGRGEDVRDSPHPTEDDAVFKPQIAIEVVLARTETWQGFTTQTIISCTNNGAKEIHNLEITLQYPSDSKIIEIMKINPCLLDTLLSNESGRVYLRKDVLCAGEFFLLNIWALDSQYEWIPPSHTVACSKEVKEIEIREKFDNPGVLFNPYIYPLRAFAEGQELPAKTIFAYGKTKDSTLYLYALEHRGKTTGRGFWITEDVKRELQVNSGPITIKVEDGAIVHREATLLGEIELEENNKSQFRATLNVEYNQAYREVLKNEITLEVQGVTYIFTWP